MTTQTIHIAGLLGALVVVVFGFLLPRVLDHFLGQNVRLLKEIMAIRKELDSTNPDARKMDEIIVYRRKKYLRQQVELFEKMKKEDRKEAAKAVLRGNNTFKNSCWKIANHQATLGTITVVAILIACVSFVIQFA